MSASHIIVEDVTNEPDTMDSSSSSSLSAMDWELYNAQAQAQQEMEQLAELQQASASVPPTPSNMSTEPSSDTTAAKPKRSRWGGIAGDDNATDASASSATTPSSANSMAIWDPHSYHQHPAASQSAAVEEEVEVVLTIDVDASLDFFRPVHISLNVQLKSNKKRRRWGQTATDPTSTEVTGNEVKRRKRRWGTDAEKLDVPSNPLIAAAAANLTPEETKALVLRLQIDDLTKKIQNPVAELAKIPERDRSPSPEPTYDAQGKRTNTRQFRYREKCIQQRHTLIQQAIKDIPGFVPPPDYRPPKIYAKIFIPVDKYPDQGFMGLIIGPRGSTHKRMEQETNTKIAIRGKGATKEGKKGGRPQPGDDEAMHVLIQGDKQENVDIAARMIRKLLIPTDDETNEHKAKQLRELALINGTLRDEVRCRVCGEVGHKIFECPNRNGSSWAPAQVVCAICGESTHITRDCRKLQNKSVEEVAHEQRKLDDEYSNFMAELTGGSGSSISLSMKALTGPSADGGSGSSDFVPPPPPPPPPPPSMFPSAYDNSSGQFTPQGPSAYALSSPAPYPPRYPAPPNPYAPPPAYPPYPHMMHPYPASHMGAYAPPPPGYYPPPPAPWGMPPTPAPAPWGQPPAPWNTADPNAAADSSGLPPPPPPPSDMNYSTAPWSQPQ